MTEQVALAAGDAVVLTARDPRAVADLASRHPDRTLALDLHVTDRTSAWCVAEQATERFGRLAREAGGYPP
jgi:NADP-dependent 3-hydroxy acid dehydrogenase YdfG